jgi:hypothetical protein
LSRYRDTRENIKTANLENRKMDHQLYMDGLKLYANSMEQLHILLDIITRLSESIQINVRMDICKLVNYERVSLIMTERFTLKNDEVTEELKEA